MKSRVKRVLITGSNGLLGQKVVELLSHLGNYNLLLTSKHELSVFAEDSVPYFQVDVTKRQDVRKVVDEFEPEVIINTAAITNVDLCETERELAWKVNVNAIEHLSYAAKLCGAHLIHLSTDYVFDGKNGPYDEHANPNPISYYGRTKLASENVLRMSEIPCTIVRTMILYGIGINVKSNFALWLIKNLSEGKAVRVVDDQFSNPTLVDDLAFAILKIIELERTGLYHVAGHDLASRADFAFAIAKEFDLNAKLITAVKTASMKQPAPRPLNSGFITLKAETELGIKPSGIEHGLAIFRNQLAATGKFAGESASQHVLTHKAHRHR